MTNEIVVILGKKGSGKTVMAREIVKGQSRLVVYDPMRQFSDCGAVITSRASLIRYLWENRRGRFRAVYQPHIGLDDRDVVREEFREVCRYMNAIQNVWFMVDEIDNCLDPRDRQNGYFKNIVQRGRHDRISIVATTIRYTDVQRGLTAQADKIICFHTHEPSDIEYFRAYFGALADDLPMLPPYHFVMYEKGQASRHEPISI